MTKSITQLSIFLLVIFLFSCKKEKTTTLSVSAETIHFTSEGGAKDFTIQTDADSWNIIVPPAGSWIQLSQKSGTTGLTVVNVKASANPSVSVRAVKISLRSGNAPDKEITISQEYSTYVRYNTNPIPPDTSGMTNTAQEIAERIRLGWNVGNSLEAIGGETAWGNPRISNELLSIVKQSGFDAIRLPCSWNQYANQATAKIDATWLNRVKEVVQLCIRNDLYVVLNIHWDGGWLENNCTPEKQKENNAKQKAFWEQIATHLRDFDEHLIFASANEPNVTDATQMGVLLSYHQTFINAVRSTGGKNAYRTLIIQGPSTDIDKTNTLMTAMPVDVAENRLMTEVHFYSPWNFAGMTMDESWGSQFYYWGNGFHSTADVAHNSTWGEESDIDKWFNLMKTQFIDKGIPVIIGEFGAIRRSSLTGDDLTLHTNSRAYYLKYVTKQATANKLIPFYWDDGRTDNNSFGIIDRNSNTVFDQLALDAMIQGVN